MELRRIVDFIKAVAGRRTKDGYIDIEATEEQAPEESVVYDEAAELMLGNDDYLNISLGRAAKPGAIAKGAAAGSAYNYGGHGAKRDILEWFLGKHGLMPAKKLVEDKPAKKSSKPSKKNIARKRAPAMAKRKNGA